jgi:hypothetical protein
MCPRLEEALWWLAETTGGVLDNIECWFEEHPRFLNATINILVVLMFVFIMIAIFGMLGYL